YGPIYFYIAAAFAKVLGDSYLPLRLVSLLASLGTLLLIAHLVWRETRNRGAALVAGGLYAATFPFSETGQDLGRVDALFTFWLVAAAYFARVGTRWSLFASGLAIGLAALTKLPLGAAPLAVGLLAYIAF